MSGDEELRRLSVRRKAFAIDAAVCRYSQGYPFKSETLYLWSYSDRHIFWMIEYFSHFRIEPDDGRRNGEDLATKVSTMHYDYERTLGDLAHLDP